MQLRIRHGCPMTERERQRERECEGEATVTVTITTTTVSATATAAAGAAADALPLPIDTLTHKSTLLFIDFHICPLCACFYPMCVCHFIKSLAGPCGPQTRSCLPPSLVIYLNLCDFNEIGSLLEHNQSDSTPPSQRFINRLKMFSSSLLFVCIFTLHIPLYAAPVAAASAASASATAVGHQKCQAINKSISRLSGISVICMKICAWLSFTIS